MRRVWLILGLIQLGGLIALDVQYWKEIESWFGLPGIALIVIPPLALGLACLVFGITAAPGFRGRCLAIAGLVDFGLILLHFGIVFAEECISPNPFLGLSFIRMVILQGVFWLGLVLVQALLAAAAASAMRRPDLAAPAARCLHLSRISVVFFILIEAVLLAEAGPVALYRYMTEDPLVVGGTVISLGSVLIQIPLAHKLKSDARLRPVIGYPLSVAAAGLMLVGPALMIRAARLYDRNPDTGLIPVIGFLFLSLPATILALGTAESYLHRAPPVPDPEEPAAA